MVGENQWRFVVQKHDASRLHYDLRLELNGVLLSWAVPKGPSLDWNDKRLAVHVEDHPIEYLKFEGIIPKHEYGGGTVMVWDLGNWKPRYDAQQDYERGELKFALFGEKLQGGWMLKRLNNRGENEWLLIKEKDSAMRNSDELNVLSAMPESVLTGRTLDEISADTTIVWSKSSKQQFQFDPTQFAKAKPAKLPTNLKPCLPTPATMRNSAARLDLLRNSIST